MGQKERAAGAEDFPAVPQPTPERSPAQASDSVLRTGPASFASPDEVPLALRHLFRHAGTGALGSWGDSFSSIEPAVVASPPTRNVPGSPQPPEVPFPDVGSSFLGFQLMAELGRGTFGRVYLARQGELADRFVALKVSTEIHAESQKLAQLQHTHIVPVYSLHREGPLQAVAMPYFGSTTLGDVLFDLGQRQALPESGKGLVSTLAERRSRTRAALASASSPGRPTSTRDSSSPAPPGPPQGHEIHVNLQMLEGLTYVEVVLWLGARLADGLAHAHERGILHRDLKPANVLLTDDGLPMLLDFNLSEDTKVARARDDASIGGTLPYMAPEHLAAFVGLPAPFVARLSESDAAATARLRESGYEAAQAPSVDARSDLYSLGIILFELLTAHHPFNRYPGPAQSSAPRMIQERLSSPPALRPHNQAVSPAVEAIVRHCLEPDPAARYQSARELKEDLERQLANLPLRHAPEPSLDERLRKWLRRHPRLTSATTIAAACGLLLVTLACTLVVRSQRLARLEAVQNLGEFREDMHSARLLLAGRPADAGLRQEGCDKARRALERFGALDAPPGPKGWKEGPAYRHLPLEEQARLTDEVGELLLLLAGSEQDNARALALNERAEACFAPGPAPRALWAQRAELAEALGEHQDALRWRRAAQSAPVRDAWDHYLLARERATRGRYPEAVADLQDALAQDPQNFAAWFLLGNCCLDGFTDSRGREKEAVSHYTACIALKPTFHASWFNRGLAHLRQRSYSSAEADFTKALELKPGLREARVLRAHAREGAGNDRAALADLDEILKEDNPPTRVFFLRERVRRRLGDLSGAQRDREEGLKRTPSDEEGWIARGVARVASDPRGALEDFARAARLNPRSLVGLHNQAHVLSERLGKTAEAVVVLDRVLELHPDLVPAWAGRAVLKARLGQRAGALADARAALTRDGRNGQTLYQAACVFALTSRAQPADRPEALRLLARALCAGFGHDLIETDSDLAPLRDDPAFRKLVGATRTLRGQAGGGS